jgi:hypothetical protein
MTHSGELLARSASVPALCLALAMSTPVFAEPPAPGRLFYTPGQRVQLEAARARYRAPVAGKWGEVAETALETRYDGVVVRSDGKTTRWVDGKAQGDGASIRGLKPGQSRADGRVYEPYQILRLPPAPPQSPPKETTP